MLVATFSTLRRTSCYTARFSLAIPVYIKNRCSQQEGYGGPIFEPIVNMPWGCCERNLGVLVQSVVTSYEA